MAPSRHPSSVLGVPIVDVVRSSCPPFPRLDGSGSRSGDVGHAGRWRFCRFGVCRSIQGPCSGMTSGMSGCRAATLAAGAALLVGGVRGSGADRLPLPCGRHGGWGSGVSLWWCSRFAICRTLFEDGACLPGKMHVLLWPDRRQRRPRASFHFEGSVAVTLCLRVAPGENFDPLIWRWQRSGVVPFLKAPPWSSCFGCIRLRLFAVACSRLRAPLTS